ncbi:MAG: cobalamin biosynthesis protein CobD [Victivallales bacterium]|nr:cobalamin biosynthesis protein CobD [Victivallales bacterium]
MTTTQILLAIILLDALFGDPVYPFHPIRVYGRLIEFFEKILRRSGLDSLFGGVILFLAVLFCAETVVLGVHHLLYEQLPIAADLWFVFIGYTHIAIKDLISHGKKVAAAVAEKDIAKARKAVSMMVGRDVERLDLDACARAAIESLAENLTDGIIAPLLFYALFGIPGLVFFKVASTMDSMVGYKNAKYLLFGRFAAELDDVFNFIPARLSAPMIAISALFVPGCSFVDALKTAWKHHGKTSSPNSGWSEATVAGALKRRLGGPTSYGGVPSLGDWIGDDDFPATATEKEIKQTCRVIVLTSTQTAILAIAITIILELAPLVN